MGAEDSDRAFRHLVDLLDEDRALLPQIVHHTLVVHDLVTDVDRRAEDFEGALHNLDRPLDACAESAGLRQDDLHAAVVAHVRPLLHPGVTRGGTIDSAPWSHRHTLSQTR